MATVDVILHALSPGVLREKVALPHDEWREEFLPRFLSTSSYEEMLTEVARFVCHVREHWFKVPFEWPVDRGVDEARRLLNAALGSGPGSRSGEFAAMQACRHGDQGGLRMVLDAVTRALQAEALRQYVDACVLPSVNALSAEESMALAAAYLDEFRLPGLEVESAEGIVTRWPQVIHQHARDALTTPA